jgi:hypothetical protein
VHDLFSFLAKSTIEPFVPLAHRTLSGAHRTVRCGLIVVGLGHASPADCAADRWCGRCWLTRQSGAPPKSPVIFSHGALADSREQRVHCWTCLCTPDTVRCTQKSPVHRRLVQVLAGLSQTSPIQLHLIL